MLGKNYGLKLSKIAMELNDAVHKSPDKQTIIHGDPKSPNFFFKKVGEKTRAVRDFPGLDYTNHCNRFTSFLYINRQI